MKIKNLESATRSLQAIKDLDKDILSLEKLAVEMSNGKYEVNLKLTLQDKEKKEVYKEPMEEGFQWSFLGIDRNRTPKEPENSHSEDLDDYLSINIIAFLIKDKQKQRDTLINELQILGLAI